MWALQFTEYGEPEVITLGEAPEPHAGPGQIRIAVRAASVNPIDWKARSGLYAQGKPLEGTGYLGFDAAGVVDEVGEGVTDVAVGDDVFGQGSNTQAEFAVLDSWARKPPSVDWAVAAAAGVASETSERVLRLLGVTEGTKLFIDGGAGGVGSAATQFAKARGAMVIASASEAQSGLPPRDWRYPGGVRRRHGRAGSGAPDRQGRCCARRCWQDTDRRSDQPHHRAIPSRLDRKLRSRRLGRTGYRRRP